MNCAHLPVFPQLIHPELKFNPNSNPPSFASEDQVRLSTYNELTSSDGFQIIEKNTRVRLKIVGTRVDATEIVCTTFS